MRREGYVGSITELWKTLCKDPASGKMHLHEWDPQGAEHLADFLGYLKKRYGSVMRGWLDALDLERSFVVSKDRFVATLQTMGYEQDHALRIFEYLDADSDGLVSLAEMDPVAQHEFIQQSEKYQSAIQQALLVLQFRESR